MPYPAQRLRRTRRTGGLRGLVRETELWPSDFIYPIFVTAGEDVRNPIASMPGIFQLSINHAVEEARRAYDLSIPGVLLFGIPHEKDEAASGAYDPEGVVQLATRAIKDALPELLVVTDVCLCEYTSHGHESGRGWGGRRCALGYDGRAGRGAAERARPRGLYRDPDHGLLREVRLRLLRSVPRGRGERPAVRRPARLPDGPRERPRGAARGRARHRGGGGHRHGQASVALPRRYKQGTGGCRSSRRRLQRERRILDAQGRRWERMAGRGAGGPRGPNRNKARGGGDHHKLSRSGRCPLALGVRAFRRSSSGPPADLSVLALRGYHDR